MMLFSEWTSIVHVVKVLTTIRNLQIFLENGSIAAFVMQIERNIYTFLNAFLVNVVQLFLHNICI